LVKWFGAPNGEIIKSEIMETVLIHFKHKIKKRGLVFGRIPIFGSLVIIEKLSNGNKKIHQPESVILTIFDKIIQVTSL